MTEDEKIAILKRLDELSSVDQAKCWKILSELVDCLREFPTKPAKPDLAP